MINGKRIEGSYRKSQADGYAATHFYDFKTSKAAIFKKETGEFVSAWKLSKNQVKELLTNRSNR